LKAHFQAQRQIRTKTIKILRRRIQHTLARAVLSTHTHTHTCMHAYIHTHTQMHTPHTHTHTRTHTYTHNVGNTSCGVPACTHSQPVAFFSPGIASCPRCVCVYYSAGPIMKLCAGGEGTVKDMCYENSMRYDEPRLVWTSLPITH
jgi:hypothetical protein